MINVHPIGQLLDTLTTGEDADLVRRISSGSLDRKCDDEMAWGDYGAKPSHVMAAHRWASRHPGVWYLDPTLSGLVTQQ